MSWQLGRQSRHQPFEGRTRADMSVAQGELQPCHDSEESRVGALGCRHLRFCSSQ